MITSTYLFFDYNLLTEKDLRQIYLLMPSNRRDKYDKYRFDKDKRLCASAYILLLYALYKKNGFISINPKFIYNDNQKPFFADHSDIYFNISHCDDGVACVLGTTNVGIDIQETIDYDITISKTVMSPKEINVTHLSSNKSEAFTKIWTFKESYLKCIGTGIDSSLSKLEFTDLSMHDFSLYNHYFHPYKERNCFICICSSTKIKNKSTTLLVDDIEEFLLNISKI